MIELAALRRSLGDAAPPAGLSQAVCALWWDAKGDWHAAHRCAQAQEDADGCWVHAYLHRVEGDLANAGYWYRRAGKPPATAPLAEEWTTIASALLPAEGAWDERGDERGDEPGGGEAGETPPPRR